MLSEENLSILEGILGDQGREKENEDRINKIIKEFKK
jgi:hypothetical protein